MALIFWESAVLFATRVCLSFSSGVSVVTGVHSGVSVFCWTWVSQFHWDTQAGFTIVSGEPDEAGDVFEVCPSGLVISFWNVLSFAIETRTHSTRPPSLKVHITKAKPSFTDP